MTATDPAHQPTQRLEQTQQATAAGSSVVWPLVVGGRTDIGRTRKRNEDAIYVEPVDSPNARSFGWFGAVADGLGGRPAGDTASQLAVKVASDTFYKRGVAAADERLRSAVERANTAIHETARQSLQYAGMASTITAAVIHHDALILAQVGDSRAYRVRQGRIERLTRDHSLVADGLRIGAITPEEARDHPRRNVVTRVLGSDENVKVDLVKERLRSGDVIVLCSDGLHGLVEDEEIRAALRDDPQSSADALVALANERGGHDNISVIVACLQPRAAGAEAISVRANVARFHPLIYVAIASIVAVAMFWALVLAERAISGRAQLSESSPTVQTTPAPVARTEPTPIRTPVPVAIATSPAALSSVPPPGLERSPASQAAASPTLDAEPSRPTARFRSDRTAYLRSGPRLSATALAELGPEAPRPRKLTVLGRQSGDRPTDPSIPADDRTTVWYEIGWDDAPDRHAFVHCSAIELDSSPSRTCDPAEE